MIHQFIKLNTFYILVKMSDSEDSDNEFKELFDVFDQVRAQRTENTHQNIVRDSPYIPE